MNSKLKFRLLVVLLLIVGGIVGQGNTAGWGYGGYDAPYFQADFTQKLTDWCSPLVNPALMYRVNQMHFDLFSFYRWAVFDESPLGFMHLSALFPVRRNHTIGFTILEGGGVIENTEVNIQTGTIRDLGTSSRYQDWWFIGNYSWRIIPPLVIGTNLKFRLQNQYGDLGFSHLPGIDLGIYYNPIDHYLWGDVGLSLSVLDLIPSQIKWENVKYPEIPPNRIRAGVRYALLNDNLVFSAEYLVDNLLGRLFEKWEAYANMFKADSAGELKGFLDIAHRMGFHAKYMFIPEIWLKAGWTNNNIPYIGFNYNLMFAMPEMINYLNFDLDLGYSFIESLMKEGNKRDERGFTIAGKVSLDFGRTREQNESRRLYTKLIFDPMDAYNQAMRLYVAGKYWEASFAFGKVLTLYPNFHLNDKAKWYLGNCYRFLYMNDIARQVYKEALEEFTTSEMRSKYLYGLQALDYREGKYDEALKNHAFIINLYGDSDIRPDADYLAGEIHFQLKNYNIAEQLLSNIPVGDPHYLYAQYTLAVINIENNKPQAAIQNLNYIINDTTQDAADQLLQDAANTKLGHLYYEMGDQLRKAVECYGRVPIGSPYGDEALLGTAWAWIKVNQPNLTLQTVEKLLVNYSESPLVPEAYLLKGYALMLLKRYAEAIAAFERCLNACNNRSFVTEEDLNQRKAAFEEYLKRFAPTAERIKKNALRKPTQKTEEERTELYKAFEEFSKESKNFFNYTLLEKSHRRFFKRKEEIINDAEYALAKASKMLAASKEAQILEQRKKEEMKIDQKLEELQKQLEEINK